MDHKLKIETKYIERIISLQKNFEIRRNDRDFQVGDTLTMLEYNNIGGYPDNAREVTLKIIYMSAYEQKEGFYVLGTSFVRGGTVK